MHSNPSNTVAGCRLHLKLTQALPEALLTYLLEQPGYGPSGHDPSGDEYVLAIQSYEAVENVLAVLRVAGVGVKEMSLQQPDLEEVFLQVVKS